MTCTHTARTGSTKARFMSAAALALGLLITPLSASAGAPGPWVEPADAPQAQTETQTVADGTIGIARIAEGRIAIADYTELDAWADLSERADIRMISPVAVAQATGRDVSDLPQVSNGLDLIRMTASDLGLSYVLIYDLGDGKTATPLARTSFDALGITGFEGPDTDGPQEAKVLLLDVYTGQIRGNAEVRPGSDGMVSVTRLSERLMADVAPVTYAGLDL